MIILKVVLSINYNLLGINPSVLPYSINRRLIIIRVVCVCVLGEGGGARAYLASPSQLGMNKYLNSKCLIFRNRATNFILLGLKCNIVGLIVGLIVIFCVSVACYRNFAVHWFIDTTI